MVHGYYFDALDSMLARIPAEIRGEITLYVSTPMGQLHRVAGLLHHQGWPNVVLFGVVNRGRDISPFVLQLLPAALEVGHYAFIKLHTKASLHLADGGSWGEKLEAALLAPGLLRGLGGSSGCPSVSGVAGTGWHPGADDPAAPEQRALVATVAASRRFERPGAASGLVHRGGA